MAKKITPRDKDYSNWYLDIIREAGLAEHSAVKGCMVIKPYGFGIWESIQHELDTRFKATGHTNAYFPLFIPKSFLSKEADHVEGFAKECAVVTHYRLKADPINGGVMVDPDAKLEEELIIRPTSETIIWNTYRNWIQSYRDLPLLINQWANVVRWEMRTRLFLRTTEFLWQEGHTAHATADEAIAEANQMLHLYADFAENFMALPVIRGRKTKHERFAGALDTLCIEAMMQDGKALQAGTSHFLGQNFARAFDVKFQTKEGKEEYVWATSWGVSTRLIGALIMAHSDDEGLILPPTLAPIQVVIVPIFKTDDEKELVYERAHLLKNSIKEMGVRVKFDDDEQRTPGWKFAEHEMRGVPLRIAIGPRDVVNGTAEIAQRDTRTKHLLPFNDLIAQIPALLDQIQQGIYMKALKKREDNTHFVDTWAEFQTALKAEGGFIYAHWDGTTETELKIKELTQATIRCIPINNKQEEGKCIYTGLPSQERVIFAKAY
ncbi:MAG: proline--tRNA ligase [Bacteroidota bacterium]|nr:proline--tRNA ligase [Bacteroidota bacterium]